MASFWSEWITLEKKEFRILSLLAESGGFSGTLSKMCDYFGLSRQTRNINVLKDSIESLKSNDYIVYNKTGRRYNISAIVPKGSEIKVPRDRVNVLRSRNYTADSVSWEAVIKVYLCLYILNGQQFTIAYIATVTNLSVSTVTAAKNVLEDDFKYLLACQHNTA